MDRDALKSYIDWLYTGRFEVDKAIARETEDFNISLLKAMHVSMTFEDRDFYQAVARLYISNMEIGTNKGFWKDPVNYVLDDLENAGILGFVVHAFLLSADDHWFNRSAMEFPPEF